jgi:hypothetical protein
VLRCLQQVGVLAVEHQLAVLVVDRCPGRYLTGVAARGQIDDLQLRVERVTGMDLGEEFARDAGEGDEDVADLEILERPRFDDREGGWIGTGPGRKRLAGS